MSGNHKHLSLLCSRWVHRFGFNSLPCEPKNLKDIYVSSQSNAKFENSIEEFLESDYANTENLEDGSFNLPSLDELNVLQNTNSSDNYFLEEKCLTPSLDKHNEDNNLIMSKNDDHVEPGFDNKLDAVSEYEYEIKNNLLQEKELLDIKPPPLNTTKFLKRWLHEADTFQLEAS